MVTLFLAREKSCGDAAASVDLIVNRWVLSSQKNDVQILFCGGSF